MRPRITIAHIVLVVAICSVAFAAIHSGSDSWAGAIVSMTFFAMLCSLLGIAFERGMWRIYWIGFATLGWSYLLLTYAPWMNQTIGVHLLGPNLLADVARLAHPAVPDGGYGGGFQSVPVEMLATTTTGGGFGGGMMPRPWFQYLPAYRCIGSSLEALVWAFAGGWVACFFAWRRQRETANGDQGRTAPDSPPVVPPQP